MSEPRVFQCKGRVCVDTSMVRYLTTDRRVAEMNERMDGKDSSPALTSLPSISSLSGNFGQSEIWPVGRTGKRPFGGNGIFRIMRVEINEPLVKGDGTTRDEEHTLTHSFPSAVFTVPDVPKHGIG